MATGSATRVQHLELSHGFATPLTVNAMRPQPPPEARSGLPTFPPRDEKLWGREDLPPDCFQCNSYGPGRVALKAI